MAVILSVDQSVSANDVLINMIKADRDKAIEFVVLSGRSGEEAEAYIAEIEAAIKIFDTKEMLGTYVEDLKTLFTELADQLDDPDDAIEEIKVEVAWKSGEGDEAGAWVAGDVKMRLIGEARMKSSGGTKATGGSRARVPVPDSLKEAGVTSWKAWLEQEYPAEFAKAEAGASYSAPRLLGTLNDEVYLAAAAGAKDKEGE